jgi:hypothetical protein
MILNGSEAIVFVSKESHEPGGFFSQFGIELSLSNTHRHLNFLTKSILLFFSIQGQTALFNPHYFTHDLGTQAKYTFSSGDPYENVLIF